MRRVLFLGLLALAPPRVAGADHVTEEAFLEGVTPDHPAVRALEEDLARAEAARTRAGTLPNPRVEFWREQSEANPRLTNWSFGALLREIDMRSQALEAHRALEAVLGQPLAGGGSR